MDEPRPAQQPTQQYYVEEPVEPWVVILESWSGLHVGMGDIGSHLSGHIIQSDSNFARVDSRLNHLDYSVAEIRYEQGRRSSYEDSLLVSYHREHGLSYQPYSGQYYHHGSQPSYHDRYYQHAPQPSLTSTPMDQDLPTSSSSVPAQQQGNLWSVFYQSPQEREFQHR